MKKTSARAANNRYRVDRRDLEFVLLEQFRIGELLGSPPFEAWGEEECRAVLKESQRFAMEVLGPLNEVGDREGCRLEGGAVLAPSGFKEAWSRLYEAGFKLLGVSPDHGGQGAPRALRVLVEEMLSGANAAFSIYAGLTEGVADLIEAFGTEEQQRRYLPALREGRWSGTMCLTEAHAGSDVGAARTAARPNADGTYSIQGSKMFISGGDHDLTENVVHLVLARIVGAAPGTKGLSLFMVPKRRPLAGGAIGPPNDVTVAHVEHKLGINGSSTCVLNFGESDGCFGELLGTKEHAGMAQMFRLMNNARIAVGVQGLGIASSAYLNVLAYARERKQGPSFENGHDPKAPRVPILDHADVRRALLDMKAKVEGIRAMIIKLSAHTDRAAALAGVDEERAAYHRGQVDLLTPLVKAYSSDQAFLICTNAVQVMGGAGFIKDQPLEQYLRDSKVFSIYEGTNHIQALDLVGRKLGQTGGAHLAQYLADIGAFVELHRDDPSLGSAMKTLSDAQEAVASTALEFLAWSQTDKLELLPLTASRFLEMMAELTVGWLLLDAATIAEKAAARVPAAHPDRAFYEGKIWASLYYARNVLIQVPQQARLITSGERSALDIPAEAFATV
jgi:alkylation response protein AidB-like acyl-CoA dehydrogenase